MYCRGEAGPSEPDRGGAVSRRVVAFLRLPPGDAARVVSAVWLLLLTRVGVFLLPFATFRRLLLAPAGVLSRLVPGSPTPDRVAWAVEAADARLPGHRTCLMRSLSTETLLRLYDLDGDVVHRIGVDKNGDGTFEAHSWIEYGDAIIIGDLEDLSRYQPLPPLNEGDES
ncbi:lasso peptide biosynthesis B2 protein [Natronobiforma cellulositropha]|uniref:lasso peptide biosynthesis B2 protein n=1 Tax=Natronobiforma cellulositropha TaxID=1679076 RepID=UPI0021D5FA63|nr:lasso peptide biosynthesis B2 protein [Natronobiforma cellulositropha]